MHDNLGAGALRNLLVSLDVIAVRVCIDNVADLQFHLLAQSQQPICFPSGVNYCACLGFFVSDDVGEILERANRDLREDHAGF
jgi:hypothetical protein